MVVDEFYYHKQRGLPLWEKIGHPLDTLTVLACFTCTSLYPPTEALLSVFIGMSAFSCLFVTKDEYVHHLYCSAGEQWMHSLLFILHPWCLLLAGWMWRLGGFENILTSQTLLLFIFMIYQTIYWNIL